MSLHQDITDREHVLCQFPSQLKEPRRYLLFPPLNPPWLHQSLVRALEFFAVKSFQFKLSTIFTFIDTCIFEINMQRHQSENCCCIGKFRNLIDEINIPASFPPSKKTKKKQAERLILNAPNAIWEYQRAMLGPNHQIRIYLWSHHQLPKWLNLFFNFLKPSGTPLQGPCISPLLSG